MSYKVHVGFFYIYPVLNLLDNYIILEILIISIYI